VSVRLGKPVAAFQEMAYFVLFLHILSSLFNNEFLPVQSRKF